ncbi:amidohydrolase family protein [Actinomycetes bacterium KLBMP 9759]
MDLLDTIAALPLVDHHVHGALRGDPTFDGFAALLRESNRPAPEGTSGFDSALGFAVRRWCAPVLDLAPHAPPQAYVERRAELGAAEVNRRFLRAAGVARFLVETGYRGDELLSPAEMAEASGAAASEVVRLESVAEELAAAGVGAGEFAERYAERLAERSAGAVGLKTVVAYRYGLDIEPARPSTVEVAAAAASWLRAVEGGAGPRLADPVLLRHVIWAGVDRGLPLQVHTGFGDPDLRLDRADPLRLTPLVEAVEPSGVPLLLLHCYPFHRNAGYLAHAYPHVYLDVGLAVPYVGAAARTVVAEALELAPFGKILYSSDAFGLAELHHLGALLWRRAIGDVLVERVASGEWAEADAARTATMIGSGNALRIYTGQSSYRMG